jgi:putrescine transport system permease protein
MSGLWLLFLLPFLIVVAMSVATNTPTAPPFSFGGEHPWINLGGYAGLFDRWTLCPGLPDLALNAFVATFCAC